MRRFTFLCILFISRIVSTLNLYITISTLKLSRRAFKLVMVLVINVKYEKRLPLLLDEFIKMLQRKTL